MKGIIPMTAAIAILFGFAVFVTVVGVLTWLICLPIKLFINTVEDARDRRREQDARLERRLRPR